jgi:hypothetical protein
VARRSQLKQIAQVTDTTIDAQTRRILNVVDPTDDQDAATKKYVDDNAGGGSAPTAQDKYVLALATSGDGSSTGVTITSTPTGDGYVTVRISGWYEARVGDGHKLFDCYFSDDGGTTAKTISNIAAGDTLYWNGPRAGWELTTLDWVDLDYTL